jgi:large subunit ribosomal protein L17
MPATPKKGPRLGKNSAHQKALLANMFCSLVAAEAIVTTEAKAKALRPIAEKLITKARKGGEHNIRQIIAFTQAGGDRGDGTPRASHEIAHRLVNEIAPRYAERPGGYLRILKLGTRAGDNAPMARIELVRD